MMKIISDIHLPKKKKEKKERKLTKEEKEKIKKRKEFFEGKRGQKRKFVVVFSAVLLSLLFFGLLRMVSSEKEFKKNFFATKCEGEWQNPANAEGMPEVLAEGTIDSFSERNSAVYRGGAQTLECRWFNEVKKQGELEKKDPCGEDYELCNLSSAKIYFSFAIDNNEDGDFSIEENKSPEEKNFQTEENSADFQPSPKEETSQPKLTSGPEISEEPASPSEEIDLDTRLIIYYSLDNGKTWNFLKKINELPLSNYLNGGYFSFDAPFIKSWYDIENLKIKIEGVVGGEEKIISFVDAMWVDTVSRKKFKAPEEISEKIFSMFEDEKDKVQADHGQIITKEFDYVIPEDGRIIATINNTDRKTGGVFRLWIYSKESLVNVLYIVSGNISDISYNTSFPEPLKIKPSIITESISQRSISINIEKKWEKIKIKAEYFPIIESTEQNVNFDILNVEFYPKPISFDSGQFVGRASFKPQEKGERLFNFENNKKGDLIMDTKEKGEGGGGGVFYLDGKGIGIVEFGSFWGRYSFSNITSGKHSLVIKQLDNNWQDNIGKRTIDIYFLETNE